MAQLADLFNNNFFSECLGGLLLATVGGAAMKFGHSERRGVIAGTLAVVMFYIVKTLVPGATLWSAFVGVAPVFVMAAWAWIVTVWLQQRFDKATQEQKKDRDFNTAADREWSASPFVHITAEPVNCEVNIGQRAITMRIRIKNDYGKPRQVWVIANVAVYRAGSDGPMLFRVPAPTMTALVPAKSHTDAHSPWSVRMSREQADQMLAAHNAGGIQVSLDHVRLTTLINLTSDPTTATTELPALGNRVVVEHLWE